MLDVLWHGAARRAADGLGGLVGARDRLLHLRRRPGVGPARADRARARRRGGRAPPRRATVLGAASSSCSYAAVAIASALFAKGASAASALAFQFASTNLVWELGLVLWLLIGWQFTLAEYLGGIVMIALMALLLRRVRSAARSRRQARAHARSGRPRPPAPRGRRASCRWRERLRSARGLVGRRPQLPRRLADALEGDRHRLRARRVRRPAAQQLLQRPVPHARAGAAAGARERARRPGDRGAQLRLLGRQRAAGRRAVVGRDQLRRRDRVPVRRPDRAADPRHLPQVLRHAPSRCGSPR